MIAHVAGVPLEEMLLPLLSWTGAALLLARAWVGSRVRHAPSPRPDRSPETDDPPV